MPIFQLGNQPVFPPGQLAHPSGIVAIGGRLDVEWLLEAYRNGLFPWYDRPPIQWWCPDPRLVIFPEELNISRSLSKTMQRGTFDVRIDTAFCEVVAACASVSRRHEQGTWISGAIKRAYAALHDAGFAHSVEAWRDGHLVGGLYGVALGQVFFGESMFHRESDASKVALAALVEHCKRRGIKLIDCQVTTPHLLRMGAREIPRGEFLKLLQTFVETPRDRGPWAST